MHKQAHFNFQKQLHRRTVLRGAGVGLALPWLSAMESSFAKERMAPKRFVAMTLTLGLHGPNLVPEGEGMQYQPSTYLQDLQDLRDQLTVVSGSSLPGVSGGHRAEASLLTGTPQGVGRARNTISIDQQMAKHLGHETRFQSLVLGASGSNSPSYTENGAMIPAESSPSQLFRKLFVDDSPRAQREVAQRIQEGRSIMDLVAEDARSLGRSLGNADRGKVDAFFESVRDLEKRMAKSEEWAERPKPSVDSKPPRDVTNSNDLIAQQKTMHDVIRLALSTDSTRFITFHTGGGSNVLPIAGVDEGYHTLSHHGKDPEKLKQLTHVESAIVNRWADFLRELDAKPESDGTLLQNTSVLLTSNLGNASNHSNRNMPVLLAGGGMRHGGHIAFDQANNYPLTNLYLSLLQHVGVETDRFSTSTGTMTGLG